MQHNYQSYKLTYGQIEDIQTLYKVGMPKSTIAQHYKVTPPTIGYHVKNLPRYDITEILKLTARQEISCL